MKRIKREDHKGWKQGGVTDGKECKDTHNAQMVRRLLEQGVFMVQRTSLEKRRKRMREDQMEGRDKELQDGMATVVRMIKRIRAMGQRRRVTEAVAKSREDVWAKPEWEAGTRQKGFVRGLQAMLQQDAAELLRLVGGRFEKQFPEFFSGLWLWREGSFRLLEMSS